MPSKKLKTKLQAIFFGEIPPVFQLQGVNALKKALRKQGVYGDKITIQDLQKINFATLISDVNAVHASKKIDSKSNISEDELSQEIEVAKMDTGTVARYELMELVQDPGIHPTDKFVYCYFWRKYYENWGYIYQTDIIQYQAHFIEQLRQYETIFYNTSIAETQNDKNTPSQPPVLSEMWRFESKLLDVLSADLYAMGYTQSPVDFKMAFYFPSENKCNWKGTHTSLLYLLTLSLHRHIKNVPKTVRDFSIDHFMVNGKEKSQDAARTIAAKVKPHLIKDKTELNADYRKIFFILEKALQ